MALVSTETWGNRGPCHWALWTSREKIVANFKKPSSFLKRNTPLEYWNWLFKKWWMGQKYFLDTSLTFLCMLYLVMHLKEAFISISQNYFLKKNITHLSILNEASSSRFLNEKGWFFQPSYHQLNTDFTFLCQFNLFF